MILVAYVNADIILMEDFEQAGTEGFRWRSQSSCEYDGNRSGRTPRLFCRLAEKVASARGRTAQAESIERARLL